MVSTVRKSSQAFRFTMSRVFGEYSVDREHGHGTIYKAKSHSGARQANHTRRDGPGRLASRSACIVVCEAAPFQRLL